jgi:hypothetical protein
MSDFVIDSTSLEENVLTALVHLDSCTAMLVLHIEPSMFPHVHYQQIARRALEYIQKYRAAPRAHIRDLFEAELRNTATATGKQYFDIFNAMETLAPNIQHDYVLDKLQDFIDKAGLRKVIEDAHTLLTNNDVLGAKLALTAPQTMPSFSVGTYFHRPDESLRFLALENSTGAAFAHLAKPLCYSLRRRRPASLGTCLTKERPTLFVARGCCT